MALRSGDTPLFLSGPIGIGVVGLFSLLVIGSFFGELRPAHAILLFGAPLLGWIPELPYLRRFRPWARDLLRVLLVGLLVSGVLVDAAWRFATSSQSPTGSGAEEPSAQDYLDFGK
jgi:hypothetical protein